MLLPFQNGLTVPSVSTIRSFFRQHFHNVADAAIKCTANAEKDVGEEALVFAELRQRARANFGGRATICPLNVLVDQALPNLVGNQQA